MMTSKLTSVVLRSDTGPNIARLLNKALAAHRNGGFVEAERLYKTVLAHDAEHFDALHLLGFLYYQRGRLDEAVKFLRSAVRRDGTSAEALWNLGLALHGLQHWEDALASYTAALARDPKNPDLLNVRAVALLDLERPQEALTQIDRALTIRPGHVEALGNRGNAFIKLNQPDEAIAAYDAALRITGGDAQLLTNRAHALRRLDRVEEALAELRKAIELQPDFAEAHFELGMTQLALGDFENGWDAYERRWATAAFAVRRRSFKSPLWTGEQSLRGKTVLLHAEQGFGDTIQFVRYVPMVAALGANVILEVQPELVSLLSGTPGAAQVIARGQKFPRFDLHCPMMSLPRAFKTRFATIPAQVPYIKAPNTQAQSRGRRLPARRPLIGIAWAGHRSHRNDLNRSLPFACFAPIFRAADAQFIGLQRELRPGDAESLRDHREVPNWGADLRDFVDTAALISQLDAVISVDTAVAHLAGAMGKPLFLLLPYAADFRWLRACSESPWYPTARLFRQPKFADWESVIELVAAQLASFASSFRAPR